MVFTDKKMNVRYLWLFVVAFLSYFAIESCGVSYKFTNAKWNTFLGYAVAIILTILNFKLIIDLF